MNGKSFIYGFVVCLVVVAAVGGGVAAWGALDGAELPEEANTTDTGDVETPTETPAWTPVDSRDEPDEDWIYNDVPPPTGTPTPEEYPTVDCSDPDNSVTCYNDVPPPTGTPDR